MTLTLFLKHTMMFFTLKAKVFYHLFRCRVTFFKYLHGETRLPSYSDYDATSLESTKYNYFL